MKVSRAVQASKVTGRYIGMAATDPDRARKFLGEVAHYVSSYDHTLSAPRYLPERWLHDIFPGIEKQQVTLRHRVAPRLLPYGEAFALAALIEYLRPGTIFEVGTYDGSTTALMAEHARPHCHIYTLEAPSPHRQLPHLSAVHRAMDAVRIGDRFLDTDYEQQITQLFGSSADFDPAPYAGKMDLVFIDGSSHTYEAVQSDSRMALKMLSPRGTIVWDDCYSRHPDVIRALNSFGMSLHLYRLAATRFAVYTRLHDPEANFQLEEGD